MRIEELDELQGLDRRVGKTYRAHLAMAKRLQRRNRHWNLALICLSLVSTLSAVALLADPEIYGTNGPTLWALIGVTTLAASLISAIANYKTRSEDAFSAYRRLQRLWVRIHHSSAKEKFQGRRSKYFRTYDDEYQAVLDAISNHSPADYYFSVKLFTRASKWYEPTNSEHLLLSPLASVQARATQVTSALGTGIPLFISIVALTMLVPIAFFLADG
ncbi:SLATT domain-containing protein [Rathayibacter festucae]|uniref:SLATT domain-containing protein n=1 Tax=Rathayibacter festucae TaxID=110937 RepID=UPI001FB50F6E|nr:SLATT domain-containing protein [Rathayibacter festucae]MCJ1702120.1 SLATT domain-containing protein [Rathayibacter festucae]